VSIGKFNIESVTDSGKNEKGKAGRGGLLLSESQRGYPVFPNTSRHTFEAVLSHYTFETGLTMAGEVIARRTAQRANNRPRHNPHNMHTSANKERVHIFFFAGLLAS
jgi:hypothetical protein